MALPARTVGKTDLQVSIMGLGTAFVGGRQGDLPEEQSLATVRAALDGGITLIDTAPLYGQGDAEERLGRALAGVPRQSYVLQTKVGRLVSPEREVRYDYTRDGALRSVEDSLRRLGLDRIDILLMHDPDQHYRAAVEEVYPVLADLRSQGVITAIGAGMNQWQMEAEFARHTDVDCFLLAGRYTLLEHAPLETFFPLCRQKGISVFLGGVFNSGILATGPGPGARYNYAAAPNNVQERAGRIAAVCDRHDVPLPAAALQFSLAHPAVTALVVGAEAPQEVQANLVALRRPIPPQLWVELRDEGLLPPEAPVPAQPPIGAGPAA